MVRIKEEERINQPLEDGLEVGRIIGGMAIGRDRIGGRGGRPAVRGGVSLVIRVISKLRSFKLCVKGIRCTTYFI